MSNISRRTLCAAIASGWLLSAAAMKAADHDRQYPVHLPPQGLFVAKLRIRDGDPTQLDIAYHHDADTAGGDPVTRTTTLGSSGAAIEFPGQVFLTAMDAPRDSQAFAVDIRSISATGLDMRVSRGGETVARGLAVVDPDDGGALLVSGWTGTTEPYGIAKYSIRDANTIEGYYLSKMSPDQLGKDTAVGDTGNGFPGTYSLTTLEKSGRTWGPHDWRLARRGDLIDLVWREDGAVICRGFGILDPRDSRSIIVNYIPVSE